MDKEAIMAEAKRRYPVGTEVQSAYGSAKAFVVEGTFYWWSTNPDKHLCLDSNSGISIWYDGKWGEIISSPKIRIPLVPQINNNYQIY